MLEFMTVVSVKFFSERCVVLLTPVRKDQLCANGKGFKWVRRHTKPKKKFSIEFSSA